MGTDVNAYVEVKINDIWHHYGPCDIRRDYNLFSKMAGLLAEEFGTKPFYKPRGLPKDVSFMTKIHSDKRGSDGHNHSWLNSYEIFELVKWCKKNSPSSPYRVFSQHSDCGPSFGIYLFGGHLESFIEFPGDNPDFLQNVRLVFWFDC